MDSPQFRVVGGDRGEGVTYDCGCPCQPTAYAGTEPGFEHCCCRKVHFVGNGAAIALDAYLSERAARRKREPAYERGVSTIELSDGVAEVAWAFPVEAR